MIRGILKIILIALCLAAFFFLLHIAMIVPVRAAELERDADTEMLAKVIYTEARGVESKMEQSAVAWIVLNRVDDERFPDTIEKVIKQRHQFAWNSKAPVTDEFYDLAADVLLRWQLEKIGLSDEVGRVLPKEYIYFASDGRGHNRFRTGYKSRQYWDFSLNNPYEEESDANIS